MFFMSRTRILGGGGQTPNSPSLDTALTGTHYNRNNFIIPFNYVHVFSSVASISGVGGGGFLPPGSLSPPPAEMLENTFLGIFVEECLFCISIEKIGKVTNLPSPLPNFFVNWRHWVFVLYYFEYYINWSNFLSEFINFVRWIGGLFCQRVGIG